MNWGTNLAEQGDLDDAELMFQKALDCGNIVKPKALINIGLIRFTHASFNIEQRDFETAKKLTIEASNYLEEAKPLLDKLVADGSDADATQFLRQYTPLRLSCHRNMAQLFAGSGDLESSEAELRRAVAAFPKEPMALQLLGKILELQGKSDEAAGVLQSLQNLSQQ